ncbi:MAG TPA: SRPBCC family protein [Gemmatimonadales bacterium]|nr:SRPBCC family protein [Gemmatimonadales bacterium]
MMDQHDFNVHVRRSITVAEPAARLFQAWRSPQTQAQFVFGAEPVTILDDRRSRWSVRVPGLGWRTWESKVIEVRENESISWQTTGQSDLPHEGTVHFIPSAEGHGTVVTLELRARVLGGQVTDALARITGRSLEDHVAGTLHNFKQLMETGEVATSAAEAVTGRPRFLRDARSRAAIAVLGAAALSFMAFRRRQARRRPMARLVRALRRG